MLWLKRLSAKEVCPDLNLLRDTILVRLLFILLNHGFLLGLKYNLK